MTLVFAYSLSYLDTSLRNLLEFTLNINCTLDYGVSMVFLFFELKNTIYLL